ncbi:NADPH-dependent FMN reductase [Phytoactinopolyspora mesophila]|uniref:NADPH-dependent FMN reductase n=1 Tax=Phytoactinopolyspora mesophila TaxID=2650750 RepID=A0A7K3M5S2_9ACTN|nr:NAD(P)H-dependent oxidoreductase [Phytoactinopolyspora mesophila]NDL58663.1 NADPH-dependent FMN reductase [Phytoactinopolyspora mesophila]
MSDTRLRVVIIIGSARTGQGLADWFAAHANRRGDIDVDVIDLTDAWLPEAVPELISKDRTRRPRAVQDLAPWLAAADGFVVVTAEHNASFPALLKNTIDWFDAEWAAKPVGFVSYGGASRGLHAVDHLHRVFTAVGAVGIGQSVSLGDEAERVCSGQPDAEHGAAATTMLDQLVCWAAMLREHRNVSPMPASRPSDSA